MEYRIAQEGGQSTTIALTKAQGAALKTFIEANIDCRFTSYCHRIGMEYSNVSAIFAGRKKISLKTLERLLSAMDFYVECQIEFIIQKKSTEIVKDALCPNLEEELLFGGKEESAEEPLNEMDVFAIFKDTASRELT